MLRETDPHLPKKGWEGSSWPRPPPRDGGCQVRPDPRPGTGPVPGRAGSFRGRSGTCEPARSPQAFDCVARMRVLSEVLFRYSLLAGRHADDFAGKRIVIFSGGGCDCIVRPPGRLSGFCPPRCRRYEVRRTPRVCRSAENRAMHWNRAAWHRQDYRGRPQAAASRCRFAGDRTAAPYRPTEPVAELRCAAETALAAPKGGLAGVFAGDNVSWGRNRLLGSGQWGGHSISMDSSLRCRPG